MSASPLITPTELRDLAGVKILDVRWRLDEPDGRPAYEAGHLPGAVYVSLDDELASHGGPQDGRHPLPTIADLQTAARRWGLDDGDTVVVYDDWNSFAAARAWWVLTDAGVADVRILDGGLSAWRDAGFALEQGDVAVARGGISMHPGQLPQLTIDEAADLAREGTLLDVRAGERYRGEVEPIDPRAGHIPGAVNLPTAGNVDADGRFLAPDALRERFAGAVGSEAVDAVDSAGIPSSASAVDAGAADAPGAAVGAYCGSGVTAAHTVFALRLAGIDAALYPGSWSQWANHPDRPVATGAER